MDFHLQVDLILQSLPESFGQTIANFHMNKIECTLVELMNMLMTVQKAICVSCGDAAVFPNLESLIAVGSLAVCPAFEGW